MTRSILVICAIILGVYWLASTRSGEPSATAAETSNGIVETCTSNQATLQDYLKRATDLGIFSTSGGRMQVDEARWKALTSDQKVQLAIAAYCPTMQPDGTGVVALLGLHDGKRKGGMVDGQYVD